MAAKLHLSASIPAGLKRLIADSASIDAVSMGANYSDEEREFLVAVDKYKRQYRRPHPTWREVLWLVKSLGYVRADVPVVPVVTTAGEKK